MSGPRDVRAWLRVAVAALALLTGCRAAPISSEELGVVRAEAPPATAPVTPRYQLELTCRVPPPERASDAGDVELWIPLPETDERQTVRSLAIEVGPPGTFEVEVDDGGARVLHVRGPEAPVVAVRAEIERPPVEAAPWPAGLQPPGGELEEWVESLRAAGRDARLAYGVALGAEGPVFHRWVELGATSDDSPSWAPVDLEQHRLELALGVLRLGLAPARAARGGAPAEVTVAVALSLRAD